MSADRNQQNRNQTQKFSRPPISVSKTNSPTPKTFAMRYPWLRTGFESAGATSKERSDGTVGILSGAVWDEKFNREYVAAQQRDREYDERHKSLQRILADIDECFSRSPLLNQKLLEHPTAKMSSAANATFLKFKQFCETWSLPFLPETVPQAITLFVLEYAANAKQAKRIVRHLAEAYDKLNPRPWRDPLVSVTLETLDEPAETEQPEKDD